MVSSLKEIIEEPEIADADDPEERFTTSGVNWSSYEALLTKLEDNSHYRVTYLDGVLEIVSPSIRHEKVKKNLAMLLEHFFTESVLTAYLWEALLLEIKLKKLVLNLMNVTA